MKQLPVMLAAFLFCGCSARYHSVVLGDHISRTLSIRILDKTDVGTMEAVFPAPTGTVPITTLTLGKVHSVSDSESIKAVAEGVSKGITAGATGH